MIGCKHCDSEVECFAHCQVALDGKHEPAYASVSYAEGDVCDINCKHCGLSGSFQINPRDINW